MDYFRPRRICERTQYPLRDLREMLIILTGKLNEFAKIISGLVAN